MTKHGTCRNCGRPIKSTTTILQGAWLHKSGWVFCDMTTQTVKVAPR